MVISNKNYQKGILIYIINLIIINMTNNNRIFKEFIYIYTEVLKFLQSVSKNDTYIGIPMVFFIINVINKQIQLNRNLTKKELMNPKLIPNSTFYRLFSVAIDSGIIKEHEDDSFSFPHEIPPHLKVPDLIEKKLLHVVG